MSFNLDDPLAGILSDGSDDSFFDDDILGKKKPAKKKDTSMAGKKNALFDLEETDKPKTAGVLESKKEALFDLRGDTKKIPATIEARASPALLKRTVSKDSFKIPQTEAKPKQFDTSKSPVKPKVSASADKIDILSEFGSEPKSLGKGKSSQSILDDILGGPSTKPGSSQASRPPTTTKSQDFDFNSFLGKTDSKTPKTALLKSNAKSDIPKEVTKKEEPRKKAGGDWLGIFQENEAAADEDNAEMPSWLVSGDTKKKKPEAKKVGQPEAEALREPHRIETASEEMEQKDVRQVVIEEVIPKVVMPSMPSILQGSTEDITAEGAALYLQQQDSQLMVAMQLKAQEERLVAMQGKFHTLQLTHLN